MTFSDNYIFLILEDKNGSFIFTLPVKIYRLVFSAIGSLFILYPGVEAKRKSAEPAYLIAAG